MNVVPEAFKVERPNNLEMYAIRALEGGEANPEQQRLALSAIIKKLSRTYDVHFVPNSPDETNFLEGRAFVGQNILKILRLDPNALRELAKEENQNAR